MKSLPSGPRKTLSLGGTIPRHTVIILSSNGTFNRSRDHRKDRSRCFRSAELHRAYCLVNAIQKLGTANKEIKSEIAAGKELDQDIANIADVIQLASSAIELVLTV